MTTSYGLSLLAAASSSTYACRLGRLTDAFPISIVRISSAYADETAAAAIVPPIGVVSAPPSLPVYAICRERPDGGPKTPSCVI